MQKIIEEDNPGLKRLFAGCCYAACHFNLDRASTLIHADYWNVIFGMCGVYSSGPYDYKRSGHLIMWSLGIVVEFPPGCAILLPSAPVEHSNTPLAEGERRSSIAFFVSAGLARWYHNGYMSDKEYLNRASEQQKKAWMDYRDTLWELGMELWKHPPKQ